MVSGPDAVGGNHDRPVRIPKAADIIAAQLRRQIIGGEYAEGDMLPPEAALVGQFRVSRLSLREALRVIESEGLVCILRGAKGGAQVQRPSVSLAADYLGLILQFEGVQIADVWLARILIEPFAVRMIAERRGRLAAAQALSTTVDLTVEYSDDVHVYSTFSSRFHEQLMQLCGNQTMAMLWNSLAEVVRGSTLDVAIDMAKGRLANHHREVVEARRHLIELIRAGDGTGAEAFWSNQMQKVYRRLIDSGVGERSVVQVTE